MRRRNSTIASGALLISAAMTLAACGGDGGGEGAAEAVDDDGSAAGSADGEVFEINFGAAITAGTNYFTQEIVDDFIPALVERVEAETPHTLEVNELFGTVLTIGEELSGIEARQVDMGTSVFPYDASALPLHNLTYYVPFSSPDLGLTTQAFRNVYESSEEFQQIYEDHNQMPLAFFGVNDYGLVTVDDWGGLDELAGMNVAGVGPNLDWLGPVGANPIQAPAQEWYTSMQTGVYEGGINYIDGIVNLSLYEVADYFTDMQFGSVPLGAININLDAWEELPSDIQDIMVEEALAYEQRFASETMSGVADSAFEDMEDGGMTVKSGDEFRGGWAEALSDLPNSRAQELDGQGLPGSEMIEAYISAQEELGHEFPVRYEIDGAS